MVMQNLGVGGEADEKIDRWGDDDDCDGGIIAESLEDVKENEALAVLQLTAGLVQVLLSDSESRDVLKSYLAEKMRECAASFREIIQDEEVQAEVLRIFRKVFAALPLGSKGSVDSRAIPGAVLHAKAEGDSVYMVQA